jgi:hypothetical protein
VVSRKLCTTSVVTVKRVDRNKCFSFYMHMNIVENRPEMSVQRLEEAIEFMPELPEGYMSLLLTLLHAQVVYVTTPDITVVGEGSSISDVLLLLKIELMRVTEVEDEE